MFLARCLRFSKLHTRGIAQTVFLLRLSSKMEIAEKPASRRKKAGFTFREFFGATSGQHPVMTWERCTLCWPVLLWVMAAALKEKSSKKKLSLSPARWRLQNQQSCQFLPRTEGPWNTSHDAQFGWLCYNIISIRKYHVSMWSNASLRSRRYWIHARWAPPVLLIHRWDRWSSCSSKALDHCKQMRPVSHLRKAEWLHPNSPIKNI